MVEPNSDLCTLQLQLISTFSDKLLYLFRPKKFNKNHPTEVLLEQIKELENQMV